MLKAKESKYINWQGWIETFTVLMWIYTCNCKLQYNFNGYKLGKNELLNYYVDQHHRKTNEPPPALIYIFIYSCDGMVFSVYWALRDVRWSQSEQAKNVSETRRVSSLQAVVSPTSSKIQRRTLLKLFSWLTCRVLCAHVLHMTLFHRNNFENKSTHYILVMSQKQIQVDMDTWLQSNLLTWGKRHTHHTFLQRTKKKISFRLLFWDKKIYVCFYCGFWARKSDSWKYIDKKSEVIDNAVIGKCFVSDKHCDRCSSNSSLDNFAKLCCEEGQG